MSDINNIYEELHSLNEDENQVKTDSVMLFMNTWGNYNVNGADADSINGGWLTPDEALEWSNKMNELGEEPFINDIDDYVGLPFEVNEYSHIPDVVANIKKYIELDEYDRKVVGAILEADPSYDFEDALNRKDKGDLVFYEDVNNDYALGEAEVLNCGSIVDAVGADKIEYYIDEDMMYETWESDLRDEYAKDLGVDIDDVDEDAFEEYAWEVVRENIRTAIADDNIDFLSDFFDYEAYGRDLSFDFTYTDYGAIYLY